MPRKVARQKPKRPKRPKVPPHSPPKPDTPGLKWLRKPKKVYRPQRRKPRRDELNAYLADNPHVADAIRWSSQASTAWQKYPTWSAAQKAELASVYRKIRNRQFPGLSATPTMTYFSTGQWEGTPAGVGMGVDEATAWEYFLAYVAHALVVEIARLVPWRLKDYPSDQLSQLLSVKGLFEYASAANAYLVSGATPGDPVRAYQFLSGKQFMRLARRDTIGSLLDWCRANLSHFWGVLDPTGAQAHWQYNGYPPVERVISGTTHPQYGFAHWTGGCWGTTSFLKAVLRTINIPVEKAAADGHATPRFMSENLYLSHGDDPYDGRLTTSPAIPIDDLFIDAAKFTSWFGSGVPPLTQQDNVARRCKELALQYLTDWILKLRCNDLQQGVTNEAASSVYNDNSLQLYKLYTVAQLQAMNLWGLLDAKIAAKGGCSSLFPGALTAAITSPSAGSTVSGSVVVNMAASGQTAGMNTFKFEISGNVQFNQPVAGATASYTWNTVGWVNGQRALTLTVTNSAGKTATASVTISIANVITAAITAPSSGSTVSGTVAVKMEVSGHTVPSNIFKLSIDGAQVFNQSVGGLSATYNWNTTTVANGPHTLAVDVIDGVSKTATASVSVDVAN